MKYTYSFFRDNVHLSDELIARRLGVAQSTINEARRLRGVDKPERCQRLQWNNLELGYLIDNADMPNELVSFAIDRSIDGVWNRKRLMGVKPYGVKIIPDEV